MRHVGTMQASIGSAILRVTAVADVPMTGAVRCQQKSAKQALAAVRFADQ